MSESVQPNTVQPDDTHVPHRGVITVCLMIATLMQALDQTIANVALPYMQGSLSASYDQITWVLTSYVVMAAIFTAPIGWLSAHFGRKNLFIACLVGFTIASMCCGIASSLVQIVLFRMLQGAFGAALVPLSQSTMLDIYPQEKRGIAISIWSMGVMVGPILGPTLGGYLTADFSWRWVFYVNVPFGIIGVLGLAAFMPKHEARGTGRFDWTGFAVLAVGTGGVFGRGLMEGVQKLFYLPEPHTDFIFANICEELGLVGALAVVALFVFLGYRGLRAAVLSTDPFARFLAFGITSAILIQAFFNISVVLALVPTKGITLPLISDGGTSVFITLASLGILLNITREID